MPAISIIQLRRGTAAAWSSANPVLAAGEPGYATDTRILKHGDGTTAWNSLAPSSVPMLGEGTNIRIGADALAANVGGIGNSLAIGINALKSAVGSAGGYIAIGSNALQAAVPVITGRYFVAIGNSAAFSVTTGYDTVAIGPECLRNTTTGYDNVAVGSYAMYRNVTGAHCVAVGESALYENLADYNTAIGDGCLHDVTTGTNNVAVGLQAGRTPAGTWTNALTTGSRNCYLGRETGQNSPTQRNDTVAVGYQALVDGNNAIAIGSGVLAGAAGAVAIGKDSANTSASTTTANEIRLGTALHTVRVLGSINCPTLISPSTADLTIDAGGAGVDVKINMTNGRDCFIGKKLRLQSTSPALQFGNAGQEQTTVGSTGGASALPALPTKYIKILDSAGTTLVIPAYAAA